MYGKSKSRIKKEINLKDAYVKKDSEKKIGKFKIITLKMKWKLKADSNFERDLWLA